MEKRAFFAALVVALLLVPVFAVAQANFDLWYDPQTVSTVSGTVISTIDYNPANPSMGPQAVVISSGGVPYTVFLGPGWYNNQLNMGIKPGDNITVTASRRIVVGQNYMVASSVMSGGRTFAFRSASGSPMWANGQMVPTPPTTMMPVTTMPTEVPAPPTRVMPAQPMTTAPPVGAGPAQPMAIMFNPDNIVRVSGRIVGTDTIMTNESNVPFVVATIQPFTATSGSKRVLLGPVGLFAANGIGIDRNNPLTVTGSSVQMNGTSYIVATSVSQSNRFMTLRTMTGAPLYSMAGMDTPTLLAPPDSNF